MTDSYDLVALAIPATIQDLVQRFWSRFSDDADRFDTAISTGKPADAIPNMETLADISSDLMWEFGPSDRGHALIVTAEWRDDLRPLARAVVATAPILDPAEAVPPCIDDLKGQRPVQPRAQLDSDGAWAMLQPEGFDERHPRADLIACATQDTVLAQDMLVHGRFASVTHSRHGGWFLGLRLPNAGPGPLAVEDRNKIEDMIQTARAGADLGVVVGSGTGEHAAHIDVAMTDVGQGLALLLPQHGALPRADDIEVLFLDNGLNDLRMTLTEAARLGQVH
ncbi:hypothetical protein [Actibacterium sp. 188UL27-1]|uniref:hypothetical protein n=1 Tax=Actibacterium sp. 188UL27-1 TaxID=2786961 RepID=UPI00195AB6E7|nr:hypothetical protein [Actibacterium sp. 188UL27-1]MBM7066275.1 hypothetical protein [Actibacterium sp. 188UL27-1]